MTVEESNKLIAEFIGARYYEDCDIWSGNDKVRFYCKLEELKFHYSWDWLMPVVEKIESIPFAYHTSVRYPMVCIMNKVCEIILHDFIDDFAFPGDSKTQATYNTIVKFIEWHRHHEL